MAKGKFVKSNRHYRFKNVKKEFFCPLCGTKRALKYSSRLSLLNYGQILTVSIIQAYFLMDMMKAKVVFLVFINWAFFEFVNKILFRKNIPCPDCGFDATWYKRDVRVAKRIVKDFWDTQTKAGEAEALTVEEALRNSR